MFLFMKSVVKKETDKFFDTIYGGMQIFFSIKFATSLLASLAGDELTKYTSCYTV